jgi:hypothetical protein
MREARADADGGADAERVGETSAAPMAVAVAVARAVSLATAAELGVGALEAAADDIVEVSRAEQASATSGNDSARTLDMDGFIDSRAYLIIRASSSLGFEWSEQRIRRLFCDQ